MKMPPAGRNPTPEPRCLSPHNVNGENSALMTCQEIIDEVANDRVWLVAEFGHNPADEHARASVPFEVNHAVGFARTVNFRPAMRTARSLMFGRYEFEFPFELRIAHDLVAQRSPPARDYLNHCLHLPR